MIFPTVTENNSYQTVTEVFGGYNHNLKISDGEFYEEKNLTSDFYPLFANRKKRGTVATLAAPHGIIGKAKLGYVDGASLYYDGADVTGYLTAAGVTLTNDDKQLVSMGAYICIFPDKLYFNTENYTDCGSMEAGSATTGDITYSLATADGAGILATVSATAPVNPANGDYWIDTSGETHVLKVYSSSSATWSAVATSYVKITAANIGKGFAVGDGVTISGASAAGTAIEAQIAALNGSKIIQSITDNSIVVIGLIDQTYTQTTGSVSVSRAVPQMDFVIEAQNRLWGCRYGLVNGKTVNEIYACKLGDFKNWNAFNGVSTDSYVASVGTDGAWTGAITHLGYPIFFKENVLHKVYISSSGAHQIVDTACRGVQAGCAKSLAIVNETLFFKSRAGICAYDGSLPLSVGENFGTEKYFDAAAGAYENKYFVSMKNGADEWSLFVFDMARGIWHREDATHSLCFARCGDELYFIASDGKLTAVNGTVGTAETAVEWSAETGLIGYSTVEQKYVSRFNLRMMLPRGSRADMYIQYDSCGEWEHCGHMEGVGTRTFMLPVRPRRCDHFRFRIAGRGDVRIYSFAKIMETGSDGN